MDKKVIYKFFDGKASKEEMEILREWVEASPENEKQIFKEREFYDFLNLVNPKVDIYNEKQKKIPGKKSWWKEVVKIAAVVAIMVSAGFYLHNEKMKEVASAINTLYIPAGQRANLTLPDGTNVWLNARTEIKYPAIFSGSKREVELNGEAYFDVTKDESKPFVVRTKQYDIEVVGTTFNVEAYDNNTFFSAALMGGSIKVKSKNDTEDNITLKPNQKFESIDGVPEINSIKDYDPYRWRDGLICFSNATFVELMDKFEKCYGIDIIVENMSLSEHIFSGKFRISDGIDNALRVLQKDVKYEFLRNSDDTVIYIK